ncbi:hypothetical protein PMAYCL1PPCAC_26857, partial [Pristionchus mayeri]
PRIDKELKETPRAQFFPPYPEDDEDEEGEKDDKDSNESAGSEFGPPLASRLLFNQTANVAIARLKEKREESLTAMLNRSDDGGVTVKPVENRICIVCNREGSLTEMIRFTANHRKRAIWVDAVRATAEDRKSLMNKITIARIGPHLCASHFLPSDFFDGSLLRSDAVPFYPAAAVDTDVVEKIAPSEIRKELVDINSER